MISIHARGSSLIQQVQLIGIDDRTQAQVSDFGKYLQHPENRRQQIICLSESGRARVAEIHRLCDKQYETLLGRIPSARRSQVLDSIGLLAQAMVAQRKGSPPAGCC